MQQQPTRQRSYQQQDEQSTSNSTTLSDKDLDSSLYLGEGGNDNVLLFGGRNLGLTSTSNVSRVIDLSSDTLSSSQSTTTPTEDWTEIPLFALPRTATNLTTTTQTSNSSNTSSASNSNSTSNNSLSNRDTLGQSLFPSHDGNGIFIRDLEESLIMDEGSIYASGLGLDFDSSRRRGTGSTTTSDSRTDRSSLSSSNNGHFRTSTRRNTSRSARLGNTRRPLHPIQQYTSSTSPTRLVLSSNINSPTFTSTSLELEEEEEEEEADDSLFTTNSSNSNMGSSWALTEAHLSTLPQSRSSRSNTHNQQNELDEDEEAGHLTLGSKWKGGKEREVIIQETRYDDLEDEDEQIRFTFGRVSGRASYPTPLPENTFIKRRHRESGRGKGSQKRSSTSGSHQGTTSISSVIIPTSIQQQSMTLEEIMIHRESIRRKNEKAIFMGRIVGSFMEVDGDTLDLVANSPTTPISSSFISTTPTQTRIGTPTPIRPITWTPESTRRRKGKEAHGIETLFNFAREELGDVEMRNREDREDYEEEEDSGNETETEGISTRARNGLRRSKGAVAEWYKEFRTPSASTSSLFASTTSNENITPTRSQSLSSLPLYLLDSLSPIPLQYSDSNLLDPLSNALRRTNSYASGSTESRKYTSSDEINPEFELEGLEYAISYWMRILQKIRWSSST